MSKRKSTSSAALNDLDTIYRPELTGRDIDLLGNLIDAWIKADGVRAVQVAMPLLEKVTAPRRAAMKAKEPKA